MSVFDLLIAEKIVPVAATPAFERYLTDRAFKATVDRRLLMPERISLATLAGPLPEGMSRSAMISVLDTMRHRFRSALDVLREIDIKTAPNKEGV